MTAKTTKLDSRADIRDMPRDPSNCLGTLRTALVAKINYTREYPKKRALLMEVLQHAMDRVNEIETFREEGTAKINAIAAKKAALNAALSAAKATPATATPVAAKAP